jgi:hypothetical protein
MRRPFADEQSFAGASGTADADSEPMREEDAAAELGVAWYGRRATPRAGTDPSCQPVSQPRASAVAPAVEVLFFVP